MLHLELKLDFFSILECLFDKFVCFCTTFFLKNSFLEVFPCFVLFRLSLRCVF